MWVGHNCWINFCHFFDIVNLERDRREWKLSAIDPHDRDTWRSGVRSAMRAASQLPGRGPTVVDMAPIPAR